MSMASLAKLKLLDIKRQIVKLRQTTIKKPNTHVLLHSQSTFKRGITYKQRKGLSLVEVLVALVFVSLAIAMFTYLIDALRMNQHSKQETAATLFAKDYMEGLRAKWRSLEGYQNLALAIPKDPPVGYELKINITDEEGNAIYSYPGGAARGDTSSLRVLSLVFTDSQDKTLTFQSVVARPTPVYKIPEDEDDHDGGEG